MTSTGTAVLSFVLRCLVMITLLAIVSTFIYLANESSETLGMITFFILMPMLVVAFYWTAALESSTSY